MEVDEGSAAGGGGISADQPPQGASTAGAQDAAENHVGNETTNPDPESDPYGTEVKPESDDEGLMEREERHLRRLEAQEQEQNEQHGNEQGGGDGNADDGNGTAPAGNTLDGHTNAAEDDEEADGYAAILDPLHGYSCPEPDYAAANALPFPTLVKRFDTLWSQRKRLGNRQPREQLLEYLLPRTLLDEHLKECSLYPLLRLILPDCDVARGHLGMKEKSIANAWAAAMHLSKDSRGHKKLVKFMDPQYAGHTATGDLSLCVKEVVAERFNCKGSKISVGQMNTLLDELQQINSGKTRGDGGGGGGGEGSAAHAWRTAGEDGTAESAPAPGQGRQQQAAARAAEKQRQKKTKAQRQAAWVEKLIKLNLSVSDRCVHQARIWLVCLRSSRLIIPFRLT